MRRERMLGERLWSFAVWALVAFFMLNLLAMIGTVVVNSFGTQLVQHLAAVAYTARGTARRGNEFQLPGDVLVTASEVVGAVVLMSGLIGVPAAYAMARREFPGKRAVMLLFLLPLLVPPITYGIPLATVLYQARLAGPISGVILANLVPTVPFVILIMIPFVEQIDRASRRRRGVRRRHGDGCSLQILVPLLMPGILAALLLVLVRTIAMFELDLPDRRPDQPDTGRRALLRGVRRRRAAEPVDRRDGGGLHGHHAGLAADRAALRQPDADLRPQPRLIKAGLLPLQRRRR